MANNGPKFVSVNLNKSYGQPHHFPHYNGGGQATAVGRGRSVGGSSGGMVVLSRNRGMAPKAVPKLSVPPPLNLPSLRKEHEKYDTLGPGGTGVGAGSSGGSRPTSSGVGWTKPAAMIEKNTSGIDTPGARAMDALVDAGVVSGSYMPPSAPGGVGGVMSSVSRDIPLFADKAVVLRGEDFPTLQAARPVSSGATPKQKDGLNMKQRHVENDGSNMGRNDSYDAQQSSSMSKGGSQLIENRHALVSSQIMKNGEYLADPLPLVRMTPRSDWADDERDTGHRFVEHERETGFLKSENYWDRDFDFPRPSFPPYKPVQRQPYGRDSENGNSFSREVRKIDTYNKDVNEVNQDGREVDKWRTPPLSIDSPQETGNFRGDVQRTTTAPGNVSKDNKYIPPHYVDAARDGNSTGSRESLFAKRDSSIMGRNLLNNSVESSNNQRTDQIRLDQHLSEQNTRFKGDHFQNNAFSKPYIGTSGKMGAIIDPMDRDKRFFRSDKPISDGKSPLRDISSAVFDEKDLFSGGVVGIIKRKKDAAKITDTHDPVRESFEAELERVQKMQELERQRIIEEQERAMEQAKREKEEREKRIQEEEEQLRRLEEEAREAAWRAEQEQIEAIRRAEEQRIAREEEKKRIQQEEERRKQAAKQMLHELEAKMAKEKANAVKNDASAPNRDVYEKLDTAVKEKYTSRRLDMDSSECENGKRVAENVKISGSFESSFKNPEMNSKPYPRREESSNFHERGKTVSSWRRDVIENDGIFPSPSSNLETGHSRPRYDALVGSRAAPRKELHGGTRYMPNRELLKVGDSESAPDDFGYNKNHRWNVSGNIDSYGNPKLPDPELHDDIADRYGDNGWGLGHSRGYARPAHLDRMYLNAESNDMYFSGRSRYSLRQPRVLPPPSLASVQRVTSVASESDKPANFLDNGIHRTHEGRTELGGQRAYDDHNRQNLEPSEVFRRDDLTSGGQKLESRCDSQSSLSVSSPPASPPHLSHDELDESEDSYVLSMAENERNLPRRNDSVICNSDNANSATVMISDSVAEDEVWTPEHDYTLQQQEEYDEDENGHRENDDAHDADENTEVQKFGLAHKERELPDMQDNVVLGFDEGVEVAIPNDDFENILGTQEGRVGVPGSSFDFDESGPVNAFSSEEPNLLSRDISHRNSNGSSSGIVTEKYASESSSQQISTLYSFAATKIDSAEFSDVSVFTRKKIVSSSANLTDGISRTQNISSLTHAEPRGDSPVKLQFGMFSGPIVPSSMPAIQIGSIHMPLHNHLPAIPSTTNMHLSQPPMFQFGQLHQTSLSQGILPTAPQLRPFVQPNAVGRVSLNQDPGVFMTGELVQDASTNKIPSDIVPSVSLGKQGFVSTATTKIDADIHHGNSLVDSSSRTSWSGDKKLSGTGLPVEKGDVDVASKNLPPARARRYASQLPHGQSVSVENNFSGMRKLRQVSGGRGRRFTYAVRNGHTRSSTHDYNIPAGTNELQRRPGRVVQRREYRVREKDESKPTEALSYSNGAALEEKPYNMENSLGAFTSSGSKRSTISKRTFKHKTEIAPWSSGSTVSQKLNSGDGAAKEDQKEPSTKIQNARRSVEVNLRQNASDDVDSPLQSGVVRVFKQPGIECQSDEDDFIEVRSKREKLNDRREQREKEIKAKSLATKPIHKSHASRRKDVVTKSQSEVPVRSSGYTTTQVTSTPVATAASQGLTANPHANFESWPSHLSPLGIISNGGTTELDRVQMPDSKNKVMSLSQNQIDEAMKPAGHSAHVSAVGSRPSTVNDPLLVVLVPAMAEDKAFSGASSINTMLAGEMIHFGAVTSPVVLPPSSHGMPHAIGAPGLSQREVNISQPFPVSVKDSSLFYEKDKHLSGSRAPAQDSEAEATISSNKTLRNDLASANDTKSFGGPSISHTRTGVVGDQKFPSQSRADEFSVSLPEDLSVETTPISLWPSLPSPQSSSGQMLSHFPSGPHSHFPFYEMNPLLGGPTPIFALSHNEESSGAQSQPQKSTAPPGSGPLGNWQHHHSSVDPFYHHPAGFSGPFVGPPGGIPGVQGAPPMVVYNHFAPVGQYGQVGLSFMGATTYIPSGKQADWKNASTPSGEGDAKNVNVTNMQRNAPSMAPPFQHVASGAPLLPLPSALPVFDQSPFPSASDLPVQASSVHIPAPPLHSAPISRPMQSQVEAALHSQVNHGLPIEQSRVPTTSLASSTSFSIVDDANASSFPTELGSVVDAQNVGVQSSSVNADSESIKVNRAENDKQPSSSSSKSQQYSQRNTHHHGYNFQRGGMAHRNDQGNEWPRRRMGFRGRNQSAGGGGFPAVKPRQIYVAKQTPNLSSTT